MIVKWTLRYYSTMYGSCFLHFLLQQNFQGDIIFLVIKLMISPETFYENTLKGKSEKEIYSKIRGLKNKIGYLKNIVEHPEYQCLIHPSETVRIYCYREYLARAIKALADINVKYTPTKAELRALSFDENISSISEIRFSIGGYFGGYTLYQIDLTQNDIKLLITPPFSDDSESDTLPVCIDKKDFLEQFREIYIGEWRSRYVNKGVLDGTQWSLDIYYSNDKRSVHIYGSNAYPYNFDRLCDLLEITEDEDSDDENV